MSTHSFPSIIKPPKKQYNLKKIVKATTKLQPEQEKVIAVLEACYSQWETYCCTKYEDCLQTGAFFFTKDFITYAQLPTSDEWGWRPSGARTTVELKVTTAYATLIKVNTMKLQNNSPNPLYKYWLVEIERMGSFPTSENPRIYFCYCEKGVNYKKGVNSTIRSKCGNSPTPPNFVRVKGKFVPAVPLISVQPNSNINIESLSLEDDSIPLQPPPISPPAHIPSPLPSIAHVISPFTSLPPPVPICITSSLSELFPAPELLTTCLTELLPPLTFPPNDPTHSSESFSTALGTSQSCLLTTGEVDLFLGDIDLQNDIGDFLDGY